MDHFEKEKLTILPVSHPNDRPGRMPIVPDRVRVDEPLQPRFPRIILDGKEHLIPRAAGDHLLPVEVLHLVGVVEAFKETFGHVRLIRAEDVADMLGVGVHPHEGDADVDVEHICEGMSIQLVAISRWERVGGGSKFARPRVIAGVRGSRTQGWIARRPLGSVGQG